MCVEKRIKHHKIQWNQLHIRKIVCTNTKQIKTV